MKNEPMAAMFLALSVMCWALVFAAKTEPLLPKPIHILLTMGMALWAAVTIWSNRSKDAA